MIEGDSLDYVKWDENEKNKKKIITYLSYSLHILVQVPWHKDQKPVQIS